MSRIFAILQGAGIALLFMVAGASDVGRVRLEATAAWVLAGILLVAAGVLGSPVAARLGRSHAEPEPERDDKVTAFPPIDAA